LAAPSQPKKKGQFGLTIEPDGPTKQIVGRDARGWTRELVIGGPPKPRKPKLGDAYQGNVTLKESPGGKVIDMDQLQCP